MGVRLNLNQVDARAKQGELEYVFQQKGFPRCFPTGSVYFGVSTFQSDIDFCFPIWEKEHFTATFSGCEESVYNSGVKVLIDTFTINAIFLHPLDYVAWYFAAEQGKKILNNPILPRNLRHLTHEQLVLAFKMAHSYTEINSSNFHEFLKEY